MTKAIDLNAELAKLKMLQGRTSRTTSAEQAETAAELGPYRDGKVFITKFIGSSTWERHPKGDEVVQILDGATLLDLETGTAIETLSLQAGGFVVVPQGAWHRFRSADGVALMTVTPLPTEHVRTDTDDPRGAVA